MFRVNHIPRLLNTKEEEATIHGKVECKPTKDTRSHPDMKQIQSFLFLKLLANDLSKQIIRQFSTFNRNWKLVLVENPGLDLALDNRPITFGTPVSPSPLAGNRSRLRNGGRFVLPLEERCVNFQSHNSDYFLPSVRFKCVSSICWGIIMVDWLINKTVNTNMFWYIYYSNMFRQEWVIIRLIPTTAQLQELLVSFNSVSYSPLLKPQQRVSIKIWPIDQLAFRLNSRMFSD